MIVDFQGMGPRFDDTVYIAPNAVVIGDVEIGPGTNIWFGCLLRGDVNPIRVGAGCNIQDGSILHVTSGGHPLVLEDEVILGHRVTVHSCHIGRGAMIGIGAIVLDGATVGEGAQVGAGAVVTAGTVIPPRTLVLGTPARPVREVGEKELATMRRIRETYRALMEIYRGMPCP